MIKRLLKKSLILSSLASLCFSISGYGCTDFLLKSEDNTVVVGRSMEFAKVLPTQIQIFPKGQQVQSVAPNNQKGLSWTSRFDYVGLVYTPAKTVVDGFNERGLSVGALWLPGTQYPNPPNDKIPLQTTLFFADVSAWLLGNFENVEQAKEALSRVYIYAGGIPGFDQIPPIHLSLHDASGASAVVEFLNGKIHLFDNPIGGLNQCA